VRVISGTAGGRKLRTLKGAETRPTSDRVREALFSSIAELVDGATVLDLYAGSGALGIEALSRGASHATFVERNSAAVKVIEWNLEELGLKPRAAVIQAEAAVFVRGPSVKSYDLVLIDPPYSLGLPSEVLEGLLGHLNQDALVVVEASSRLGEVATPEGYLLGHRKKYGDTMLVFMNPFGPKP